MLLAMENTNDAFFEDDFEEDEFEDDDLDEDDLDEHYDVSELSSSDTVGLYLKEMARVPLLNTEEEVALAMRFEAGLEAERKLEKEPNGPRALEWRLTI